LGRERQHDQNQAGIQNNQAWRLPGLVYPLTIASKATSITMLFPTDARARVGGLVPPVAQRHW